LGMGCHLTDSFCLRPRSRGDWPADPENLQRLSARTKAGVTLRHHRYSQPFKHSAAVIEFDLAKLLSLPD